MAIESATHIAGLVNTNPPGSDNLSTADDHLRLIKAVLLTDFPTIDAPIDALPAEINGLNGLSNSVVMVTTAGGITTTHAMTTAQLTALIPLTALTADRALVTDDLGDINATNITAQELLTLDNISSNIQAQLNLKQASNTYRTSYSISLGASTYEASGAGRAITHNLGTDDVIVILSVKGSTDGKVGAAFRLTDGTGTSIYGLIGASAFTYPALSIPATGKVQVVVLNYSLSTQTVDVTVTVIAG